MRPLKGLDVFCGAMGSTWGFHQAGFEMVGVDKLPRRAYPTKHIEYMKIDAREILGDRPFLDQFDLLYAGPPCKVHSQARWVKGANRGSSQEDYLDETREAFQRSGKPYIIENVPNAPLINPLTLCGSMFGDQMTAVDDDGRPCWLRRHRLFEANFPLVRPHPCRHEQMRGRVIGIYGNKGEKLPGGGETCDTLELAQELMGISWMSWDAIKEAIPPVYTMWLGRQAREYIRGLAS